MGLEGNTRSMDESYQRRRDELSFPSQNGGTNYALAFLTCGRPGHLSKEKSKCRKTNWNHVQFVEETLRICFVLISVDVRIGREVNE